MIADGVQYGLSSVAYHADGRRSASQLKALDEEGPAGLLECLEKERKTTSAMRVGTGVNALALEGAIPEPESLMKGWKLKQQEAVEAISCWKALMADRHAGPILRDAYEAGNTEVSVFHGNLRCRVDVAGMIRALADLKKTIDASPEGFPRQCRIYRHGLQAVHYMEVWERATGERIKEWLWLAVQPPTKDRPAVVGCYTITRDRLAREFDRWRRLMAVWDGLENGSIPWEAGFTPKGPEPLRWI